MSELQKISIEQIKEETAAYMGVTLEELVEKIQTCRQDRADMWDRLDIRSVQQIEAYYKGDPYLIYNLVDFQEWAYDVHFPNPHDFGKKVLDFGCGLGYTGEFMALNGKDVTIADVPTKPFEFAKHRFMRKGIKHKEINLNSGMLQLTEKYDAIFCIDVIEHLVNPVEMLWHFYNHLEPNGMLYITNLEAHHDDIHRDHIIYQPPQIKEMMRLMGYKEIGGSTWQK